MQKIESIRSTITLANGLEMPRLGLGVWRVKDEAQLKASINTALENKYWHIDTATIYGNEAMVGKAIAESGRRKELFITTKLWNSMHEDVEKAFDDSLKALRTDYIDLWLIHWPAPTKNAYIGAWKAMCDIYRSGRVRAIGVSNFLPDHIQRCAEASGMMPHVHQVERHPLFQQNELAKFCRDNGIVMEAYSPLASGHLDEFKAAITPIAEKYGKTEAQIVLRWQLDTNWVCIPKSVTPSRIAENADIFDFSLDADDIAIMAKIDANQRFLPNAENGPQ